VKKCIVTMTVGERYIQDFNLYAKSSWLEYCQKYSIDLIILDTPLDKSLDAKKRSPAWQKLLILSQDWSSNYDQMAWLDSDIIINSSSSPDIFSFVPISKLGLVEAFVFPTPNIFRLSILEQYKRWDNEGRHFMRNENANSYYLNRGIAIEGYADNLKVLQTGVVVCSPSYHKRLFEEIYFNYEDYFGPSGNYEMPAMSFEIYKSKLWEPLPQEFNIIARDFIHVFYPEPHPVNKVRDMIYKILRRLLLISDLKRTLQLSYFMHFAGSAYLMSKVPTEP
jgi:hypothetical protein